MVGASLTSGGISRGVIVRRRRPRGKTAHPGAGPHRRAGMKQRLRREIVDVGRLHGARLEAVRGVVSDLTARTFEGERTPALLELSFGGGDGIERRIALYRNVEGEVVGYVTSLRQDVRHDGRTVTIFRAVAALRPEYRHFNSTGMFGFHEAARLRLRHPWRKAY